MSLASDVASWIIAGGLGTAIKTDIFIGQNTIIPAGDGPLISIVETQGMGAVERHGSQRYVRPSAHLTVRAVSATAARAKAALIYTRIVAAKNVTVGDSYYLWIRPVSEPFDLPPDGLGRARYAFNLESMARG